MAQPFSAFQGDILYLDALILVGVMDAASPWFEACDRLIDRALNTEPAVRLVTATLAIDEAVFVLLQQLVQRPPHEIGRNRGQYLRAHPETVREIMASVDPWIGQIAQFVHLEPVLPQDIEAMREEMRRSGRLPRDAIHLAVMRRLGIPAIASDDDDFDGYPNITLYKP
jgi:predicted nucleic acid-binding protein